MRLLARYGMLRIPVESALFMGRTFRQRNINHAAANRVYITVKITHFIRKIKYKIIFYYNYKSLIIIHSLIFKGPSGKFMSKR